jgi:hypothetical protein
MGVGCCRPPPYAPAGLLPPGLEEVFLKTEALVNRHGVEGGEQESEVHLVAARVVGVARERGGDDLHLSLLTRGRTKSAFATFSGALRCVGLLGHDDHPLPFLRVFSGGRSRFPS